MSAKLPRLLNNNMNEVAVLRPSKLTISPNGDSLSTASMTLPDGEPKVHVRDWVELYTAHGSAGIYRVTRQKDDVGNEQRLTLTHGLCALEDAVIPGEGTLSGSPAKVLEAILSHQKRKLWVLGEVGGARAVVVTGEEGANAVGPIGDGGGPSPLASVPDVELEYSYTNAMDALENLMDRLPEYALTFDQTSLPWKLGLAALSSQETAEARLSRNLRGVSVEDDDSELCTRVYIDDREGFVRDGPTIGTWGPVERVLTVPDGATDAEVTAYVDAYLEEHKNPARTITLDAQDLSGQTLEPLDAFRLWKLSRVPLPLRSEVLRERIRALNYPDVFGDPAGVRVTMGEGDRSLCARLADLMRRATASERAAADTGKRVSRNSSRIQQNITRLEDTWTEIKEFEGQTGDLFNTVFIDLDAKQAQINLKASSTWVSEVESRVSSAEIRIDGMKAEIELKVERDGVISAIRQTPETIKIQAKRIELDGYVTASQLSAQAARIDSIFSGFTSSGTIIVGSRTMLSNGGVSTDDAVIRNTMSFGGYTVSWKTATIGGTTITYLGR